MTGQTSYMSISTSINVVANVTVQSIVSLVVFSRFTYFVEAFARMEYNVLILTSGILDDISLGKSLERLYWCKGKTIAEDTAGFTRTISFVNRFLAHRQRHLGVSMFSKCIDLNLLVFRCSRRF